MIRLLPILIALWALPALAQDPTSPPPADPPWLTVVLAVIAALSPQIASMFMSSNTWYGKIINALALGFLKNRPDPQVQDQ